VDHVPLLEQAALRSLLAGQVGAILPAWRVSSPYGPRLDPFGRGARWHHGIDYAAPMASPVPAVLAGVVSRVDVEGDGQRGRLHGNAVQVSSGAWSLSYLHLLVALVAPGERVARGQLIGLSGASGRVTGPHLHLALFYRGRSVDPSILTGR